jgi:nucleoside-diphosphate-sugar epimerase
LKNGVFNGRRFVLVNLAPLWVLPGMIEALASHGLQRVIAFGSTSRFSKQDSPDRTEQELVQTLAQSEYASTLAAEAVGIPLTLFRPTMIYSGGGDQNVSAIARFVRRYRVFPLLGQGRGLRQPVHAEDLARVCLRAIERPASAGKSYDLGGGERLSYREMVRRICKAVGRRPLLVTIPRWLFATAVGLARLLPRYRHINVAMIDRMNQDLVYDQSAAEHDLGWSPRRFLAVGGR